MAFWGCSFSFNGIPCEDFDLMVYNLDGASQSSGKFATGVSISEETVSRRWKPFFYGTQFKNKLSFTLVFGINLKRIENRRYLNRHELEEIATWLTGHNEYLWLEIHQEDLEHIRYKCIVTALEIVDTEMMPVALRATFTCDSPYAYMYPQTFEFPINGETDISFFNESSHNGYYMPIVEYEFQGSQSLQIVNHTDKDDVCSLKNLPLAIQKVTIDNDHCIITTDDGSLNPYPYFNFHFLRLVRGINELTVTGNGVLRIICEFPINVGG